MKRSSPSSPKQATASSARGAEANPNEMEEDRTPSERQHGKQPETPDAFATSEVKFRLLAENFGDIFWLLDLDPLRLTYVSPAFERIWGHTVEEVLADFEVWEGAIHPDDFPAVNRAFSNWIEDAAAGYEVEYRIVGREGQIRWIADRGMVLDDCEGKASQMCGIARDITERKHAETVLAEKAGEMRAIIEGTADGILIANFETMRFTFGNPAMCRMLGVTPSELLTMGLEMIYPEERLPEIREKFDAMELGELSVVRDVPLRRRDGAIRHIDVAGSVVVINGHRCLLGVFHDVSALRRAEAKFSALLEAAPDAMMIHDSAGRIQIINAQAEKLFGYRREELIGRTMERLMPERYRRAHVRHRESYTPQSPPRAMGTGLTLFALHKDGREIPVEISLSNLGSDGGAMVMSSIRDVSGRVAAEEALRQSQRLAQSTFEAIPAHLAVLDEHGVILSTNDAWKDLAAACPESPAACGPGESYLEACLAGAGDESGAEGGLAAGIRDVLSGGAPRFVMEFPLQASEGARWFVSHVTPFRGNGPRRVVVAHLDITLRKRAERVVRRLNEELEHRVEERTLELRRAHETIQSEMAARLRLEQEILEISERERQRIGRDLHDDLGQQLAGAWCLSLALENELKALGSAAAPSAARITQTLQNAMALTRSLARGLHPVAVEAGGLGAALKELAAQTGELFHVNCTCQVPNPAPDLDQNTATHLYRIAQESVTNAVRHGKASLIAITLEAGVNEAVLTISDNGVGLAPEPPSGEGMGLRIMAYRAHMIGGRLDTSTGRAGGTVVSCACPLSPVSP